MRSSTMHGKYFFIGDTNGNTGPNNVNKGIVSSLTENFTFLHSHKTISKFIEAIWKTLFCKVVIVSAPSRCGIYMVKLARLLNKKSVYIMHGCCEIEFELNQTPRNEEILRQEQNLFQNVDLILPVSKKFSEMVQCKFPQYQSKISFLHNGVEKPDINTTGIRRIKGSIIAVGGDRKVKNNITIAEAMKKTGIKGILKVYGYLYNPDLLPKGENIKFEGLVSQEQLYHEMLSSELYVLNSIYEPFALSVFDALFCGCSILISQYAGALELLEVTEHDVIYNPMDKNEIATKITYLLEHPNNSRLIHNLNVSEISYHAEIKKLEKICEKLIRSN